MITKPKIITICGSSRFIDLMSVCAWILERDENAIVLNLHLLPEWYGAEPHHQTEKENVARQLDDLHLQKILMSDEIFVVDYNGYIGKSTRREIEFAHLHNKKIRWYREEFNIRNEIQVKRSHIKG